MPAAPARFRRCRPWDRSTGGPSTRRNAWPGATPSPRLHGVTSTAAGGRSCCTARGPGSCPGARRHSGSSVQRRPRMRPPLRRRPPEGDEALGGVRLRRRRGRARERRGRRCWRRRRRRPVQRRRPLRPTSATRPIESAPACGRGGPRRARRPSGAPRAARRRAVLPVERCRGASWRRRAGRHRRGPCRRRSSDGHRRRARRRSGFPWLPERAGWRRSCFRTPRSRRPPGRGHRRAAPPRVGSRARSAPPPGSAGPPSRRSPRLR